MAIFIGGAVAMGICWIDSLSHFTSVDIYTKWGYISATQAFGGACVEHFPHSPEVSEYFGDRILRAERKPVLEALRVPSGNLGRISLWVPQVLYKHILFSYLLVGTLGIVFYAISRSSSTDDNK